MASRRCEIAIVLSFVVTGISLAGGAGAATKPVDTYCSTTGDLCFGVVRKSGAIYLDITTAARYFTRYNLCVKPPVGAATCRNFPVRSKDRFYESSVLWHRNYPNRGAGLYRVTWSLEQPLGPTRSFRLS